MVTLAAVLTLILTASACRNNERVQVWTPPRIEVTPLARSRGQWKVLSADKVTLSVTASGARKVRIWDLPEGAEEQVEIATLNAPGDLSAGKFTIDLNFPEDFAGELWAEAIYPDNVIKETERIPFTTSTAIGNESTELPLNSTGGSVGTDESARSDKFTGGRIEHALLKAGDPNIRITINVPAFQLTFWQSGREVKTYDIGIGRKDFPLVIGERQAQSLIFNPQWIPPDSSWVRRTSGVEPYERIKADDPRNPLGKIKIPLGDGYLIHEAAKRSDIGNLVSHGCVRMLTDDLFDLAGKIIVARGLPISPAQIADARKNTDRLPVRLGEPLLVDINYDTQVVEGGVLHLFPDVYERGAFSVESLRAELQSSGVDALRLDDRTLREMISRVNAKELFAIRVSDIKAGRFDAGQTEPLVAKLIVERRKEKR